MFSEKVDHHITMLQRVVSLIRDLVLATIVFLTAAIIYLGGDPSKLNTLDWMGLVFSSFFIVLGPIVGFLIAKVVYNFFYDAISLPLSIIFPKVPLPKGPLVWFILTVCRVPRRTLIFRVRLARLKTKALSQKYPRVFQWLVFPVFKTLYLYNTALTVAKDIYPYMSAVGMAILYAVGLWMIIRSYVP